MPFECEYGTAQSRVAARTNQTRWSLVAGAAVQFPGWLGKNRMPDATLGKPGAGFVIRSQRAGENTWDRMATSPAPLHEATVRPVVSAHPSPAGSEGACSAMG